MRRERHDFILHEKTRHIEVVNHGPDEKPARGRHLHHRRGSGVAADDDNRLRRADRPVRDPRMGLPKFTVEAPVESNRELRPVVGGGRQDRLGFFGGHAERFLAKNMQVAMRRLFGKLGVAVG